MDRLSHWITDRISLPYAVAALIFAIAAILVSPLLYPGWEESAVSRMRLIVVAVLGSFVFVAAVRQVVERARPRSHEVDPLPARIPAPLEVIGHLSQLPPTPADFVGRDQILSSLSRAVLEDDRRILGIFGMGGIGKTTLAYRFIELLGTEFPNGQIALDMMGLSKNALTPEEAMENVLRAHNPAMSKPATVGELRAMYFSTLRDRKEIILFDNVADAEQIEDIIPPKDCLLIVTSRQQFALPGMHRASLGSLSPAAAESLLLAIAPRVSGHERQLAASCTFHPLAVRLAASALAVDESLSPEEYLRLLLETQERLSLVEASLDLSYRLLHPELQARWKALSVCPADFDRPAADAVMALGEISGQQALSSFLNLSVLEFNPVTERFRLHDLFRQFAESKMSEQSRIIALLRHAQHFQSVAGMAATDFSLGGETAIEALALIDMDWHNISAARSSIHELAGEDRALTRVCAAFCGSFINIIVIRLPAKTVIEWTRESLDCAKELGDPLLIRGNMTFLANSLIDTGEYAESLAIHQEALEVSKKAQDRTGLAMSLSGVGNAYLGMNELDAALYYTNNSIHLSKRLEDRRGLGHGYRNLGAILLERGDLAGAEDALGKGLEIAKEFNDPLETAISLNNLGLVLVDQGKTNEAIRAYEEALELKRTLGDLEGLLSTLVNLAELRGSLGDETEGLSLISEAKEIAISLDSHKLKRIEEIELQVKSD